MGWLHSFCSIIAIQMCNAGEPSPSRELMVKQLQLPSVRQSNYYEDSNGQLRYVINYEGKKRSFQIYAKSQSKKPRPAILLLHGSSRTGVSLVQKWKNLADENDIILIGPTAISNWSQSNDESFEFIDAIIGAANAVYKIDPNQLYVFGHSQGANYALKLAYARSDVFAAAAIHAGQMSWMQRRRISEAKRKIPLLIINGTHDKIFALGPVAETGKAFAEKGHPTALYVLKGHTHWYYDQAASINSLAWHFLSYYKLN